MKTFIDVIRAHAKERPEFAVFSFLDDEDHLVSRASFAELDCAARRVGAYLRALSAEGARVLLLFPPGRQFVEAFLGCLYAGAIAVPAYLPKRADALPKLYAIVADAGARFVLTTPDISATRSVFAQAVRAFDELSWLSIEDAASGMEAFWQRPDVTPESVAFLQYTSGSTGDPKGVMISHDNLSRNSELIHRRLGTTREENALSWLPPYHDMGLMGGILQPLHVGFHSFLASPTWFVRRPERWLSRISNDRITGSGGPNFAFELCVERFAKLGCESSLDLGSWRIAFTGAEPVRHETLRRFVAAFGSHRFDENSFCSLYGMAETTLMISGNAPGEAVRKLTVDRECYAERRATPATDERGGIEIVSCGTPLAGHEVRIVDPDTRLPLPDGRVGEVWIAGRCVAKGYWGKPELTKEQFSATLAAGGGDELRVPFFRSGDLGFYRDGQLYISGRLKDVIVVRGRNHYPQDIEATVRDCHPRLRSGQGVAFAIEIGVTEQVVIAHEVTSGDVPVAEIGTAVQRAVAAGHELQVHTVTLLRSHTLPKTSSGKPRRVEARQAFLGSRLQSVGSWVNPRAGASGLTLNVSPAG